MPFVVERAGVDTWSPAWRVDPDSVAGRELSAAATVALGAQGAILPEKVAGHRVGWLAERGLLWAEGHPSSAVGGEGLLNVDRLGAAYDGLRAALGGAGVPVPVGRAGSDVYGDHFDGTTGLRRLDATMDLRSESGTEGLAVLAGIAAIAANAGRTHAELRMQAGHVQTVYFRGHGGKRVLGRVYDKGVETGEAAQGRWLRPEDQRRFVKGTRRAVDELTPTWVAGKFRQRFAPLWRSAKGVTVAGLPVLSEKLLDAAEAGERERAVLGAELDELRGRARVVAELLAAAPRLGEDVDALEAERDELDARISAASRKRDRCMTLSRAETLAGHLLLRNIAKDRATGLSRATRYRREAELAAHGLVVADGVLQEVEVDLGSVLEQALETDAWERRG